MVVFKEYFTALLNWTVVENHLVWKTIVDEVVSTPYRVCLYSTTKYGFDIDVRFIVGFTGWLVFLTAVKTID